MSKAKSYTNKILSIISEIEATYKENINQIKERELESTDLSHEIEFSNFNAYQGYRLAKELQTVLRERREMKNENETLHVLYEFFEKFPQLKNGLAQCNIKISQKESQQRTREYSPRVRTDLTISEVSA